MTAGRPEIEEVCDCLALPRFQVRLPGGAHIFWAREAAEIFLAALGNAEEKPRE